MKKNETKNSTKAQADVKKVTIYGTIAGAFYGSTKFSKEDMYRVSLKIDASDREALVEASKDMYADSPDSFIPKWFKDEKAEYINIKSKFDIKMIYDGDKEITSLNDALSTYGNINGSKVGIALKLTGGSVYPIAIKIYEFANADFSDLFDEEIPF